MKSIGCFVSSHGYGHATRICAVLEALNKREKIVAHIYTSVNESVFRHSLFEFHYHYLRNDIGLIQNDAFSIDIDRTVTELEQLIPYRNELVAELVQQCAHHSFLLCDISALGIIVAAEAGIPSVLIENFTWDWIYAPYAAHNSRLAFYQTYFENIYSQASFHVQTKPCCQEKDADVTCDPIFREVRQPPEKMKLSFRSGERTIVLITMGGIGFNPQFIRKLRHFTEYFFIVAGQPQSQLLEANILLLDNSTKHYHPDLINCADITVFKLGYSTLAECYQAGKPSLCVKRDDFAESLKLESFARQRLDSHLISQAEFLSGDWLHSLPEKVSGPSKQTVTNGAEKVASFLSKIPYS